SAKPAPVVVAKNEPPPVIDRPTEEVSKSAPSENTDNQQTVIAAAKPTFQLAPPPEADVRPMVSRAGPGPGELIRVAERLKSSLTSELLNNFELFLYVSKANN